MLLLCNLSFANHKALLNQWQRWQEVGHCRVWIFLAMRPEEALCPLIIDAVLWRAGSGEGRLVLQLSAFVERYYSIQNVSSVVIVPVFLFALLYSRAGWGLPGAATAVWWGWGSALVLCLTVLQGWGESVRNAQSWAHVPRLITDQRISRLYIGLLPRSSKG